MPAKKKSKQGRKSLSPELKRKIARRFSEIRDRDFKSARQLEVQLGSLGKTAQGWCAPANERAAGAWTNVRSPDLVSLLAFAEATNYRIGYLLGDDGPEREAEGRPRRELADDLAAYLNRALPRGVWDTGFEVDGEAVIEILLARVAAESAQLQPLLRLWAIGILIQTDENRVAISKAIEQASAAHTGMPDSLLKVDSTVLVQQRAVALLGGDAHPALKPAIRRDEERQAKRARRNAAQVSPDTLIRDGLFAMAKESPAQRMERRSKERELLQARGRQPDSPHVHRVKATRSKNKS